MGLNHAMGLSHLFSRIFESKHLKMIRAISENNSEKVTKLAKKMDINTYTFGGPRWTFLHYASMIGRTKIVECLIRLGAHLDPQTCQGKTPLFLAIEHRHPDAVKTLLEQGADKTIPATEVCIQQHIYQSLTPLGLAQKLGLTSILNLLGGAPSQEHKAMYLNLFTHFPKTLPNTSAHHDSLDLSNRLKNPRLI